MQEGAEALRRSSFHRMNLLTFSTLYPNPAHPAHGIFVETRLRHLLASGAAKATVLAPVPWFPFSHAAFGEYAGHARTPHGEVRNGIEVLHPRYVVLPKVGMTVAPLLLAASALREARRLLSAGRRFDLLDAHYFYPDGVAAAILGARLGLPVVITARGTDLNLIPRHALPRRMIQWAARKAAGLVTVCQALKDTLVELGVESSKIEVLRNGVDLELFRPVDRKAERTQLGLSGQVLLSVGGLIERKGHHLAIRGLADLPGAMLLVAGDGPEATNLKKLAGELGLSQRVKFLGVLNQSELRRYYGAADALVLASSREGWANVLLESMACGTPVVATRVWGTPEVVAAPEAGVLMTERTPQALAQAVKQLFAHPRDRAATRRYAEGFGWGATTRGQIDLFGRILAGRAMTAPVAGV
jgi:glycosyltransferase involved in cell wall biosynthesis